MVKYAKQILSVFAVIVVASIFLGDYWSYGSFPIDSTSANCSGTVACVKVSVQASNSITSGSLTTPFNIAASGATLILAGVTAKTTYITALQATSFGATNFSFNYGTATNACTGATSNTAQPLTGTFPGAAQYGIAWGAGVGAVVIVPAGDAVCLYNSAAIQVSGTITTQQF
jgi:hypothetical protein